MGFDDKDDPGNGVEHLTGEPCIEGCGRPAGTAWSPHWCFECNVKRIRRINSQLDQAMSQSLPPCNESGCKNSVRYSYLWPGRLKRIYACYEHTLKAQSASRAMGLPLGLGDVREESE